MSQYDDELRALLRQGRLLEQRGDSAASPASAASPTFDPAPPAPAPPRRRADPPSYARAWRDELDERTGEHDLREELDGRRGRPTRTLQATWIDPAETPFTPVPRPGKGLPARLFALAVLACVFGLLAWMIVPEVKWRIANVDTIHVRDGVLTAQPVPLAPPTPATVVKLFVDAGHLPSGVLPAGTPIAELRTAGTDAFGSNTLQLTAPFDARFVSVDTLEGAVTLPGTPVATVYDPTKMYVIITVRTDVLDQLRRGMRASLKSRVLDHAIDGTVVAAVPLLGTDENPSQTDLVNVRIQPDEADIRDLVPGIRFDAAIDTQSAPDGAQPLVITAADGAVAASTSGSDGGITATTTGTGSAGATSDGAPGAGQTQTTGAAPAAGMTSGADAGATTGSSGDATATSDPTVSSEPVPSTDAVAATEPAATETPASSPVSIGAGG